jgi:phosphopantothenate---cysteine ligase (CTP)
LADILVGIKTIVPQSKIPVRSRVIVTCGPSYEPIDRVRRLTNFSTGELGLLLVKALTRAGFRVICLKGAGATCQLAPEADVVTVFGTNAHLLAKLRRLARRGQIAAVFHAAALTDFRVKEVRGSDGCPLTAAKISSRAGPVTITLEPASKVISELRTLFPDALLTGWKYEPAGSRTEAIVKAARQIAEARTDFCVVNGRAYGAGFGLLDGAGELSHHPTKVKLCAELARKLADYMSARPSRRKRRVTAAVRREIA